MISVRCFQQILAYGWRHIDTSIHQVLLDLNKLGIPQRIIDKRESSENRKSRRQPGENKSNSQQGCLRLCHVRFIANVGQHGCGHYASDRQAELLSELRG